MNCEALANTLQAPPDGRSAQRTNASTRFTLLAVQRVMLASLLIACGPQPGPTTPTPVPTPGPKAAAEGGRRAGPPIATPGEHMQYKLALQGVELATYNL